MAKSVGQIVSYRFPIFLAQAFFFQSRLFSKLDLMLLLCYMLNVTQSRCIWHLPGTYGLLNASCTKAFLCTRVHSSKLHPQNAKTLIAIGRRTYFF